VDVVDRHICCSLFVWLEQAAPVEKIKEAAVVPSAVVARDRLEMARRSSALKSRSGLARRIPGIAIGFRPQVQR